MPFGLGPFMCAGRPLAIIELRAVMCAMVQQCEVRVAHGSGQLAEGAARDVWNEAGKA